jgi:hypothetical protein
MILDTPAQIAEYRLRALRQALKLEIAGLRFSRGSAMTRLRKDYPHWQHIHTRTAMLDAVTTYLNTVHPLEPPCAS